jgi:hypothetical protein
MHLRRSLHHESSWKIPADARVCVPDTDAFYAQALRAGAISVIPYETLVTATAAPRQIRCGNT